MRSIREPDSEDCPCAHKADHIVTHKVVDIDSQGSRH